jgi:excisionase family DNA binding protein
VNSTDIQDPFMTVAEVAGLLKLNQQTVRNWIDQGSLPAVRVGRRVRIRRSDLERVLADGYSGGGSASRQAAPGPSAEDFWGGEAVGTAEPPPATHDPLDVATPPADSAHDPPTGHPAADSLPHRDDDRR